MVLRELIQQINEANAQRPSRVIVLSPKTVRLIGKTRVGQKEFTSDDVTVRRFSREPSDADILVQQIARNPPELLDKHPEIMNVQEQLRQFTTGVQMHRTSKLDANGDVLVKHEFSMPKVRVVKWGVNSPRELAAYFDKHFEYIGDVRVKVAKPESIFSEAEPGRFTCSVTVKFPKTHPRYAELMPLVLNEMHVLKLEKETGLKVKITSYEKE